MLDSVQALGLDLESQRLCTCRWEHRYAGGSLWW